jgi:hypothetical protein
MKQTGTFMLAICIALAGLMVVAATRNAQGRGSKSSEQWCIKIKHSLGPEQIHCFPDGKTCYIIYD